MALWEASDRVCGKRLKVMIPTLLPALEQHGRLKLNKADRELVLGVSAATIDRLLVETKIAAAGGKRRRVGFYSAVRREVPIRTFNDWNDPPPGFCEVDMVAHGGTSVAGSFIQTLTMVDVATGWTECMPLVTREGGFVVQAIERAQSLFPWLIRAHSLYATDGITLVSSWPRQREPIHYRLVERRQIERRNQVMREPTTDRVRQRHGLGSLDDTRKRRGDADSVFKRKEGLPTCHLVFR